MKNYFLYKIKSRVKVIITGNNVNRFILRVNKNNIDIFDIKTLNSNKASIIINYDDFDKLLKLNTVYEINIEQYLGIENKKRKLFKYYHVIIMIFLCIIFLYFLSNIIFSVEIVTTDEDMKKKLTRTLSSYDISKFRFQKSFDYIQNVKEKILDEYHDNIEWVEIEKIGTKYILKFEPRIIKEKKDKPEFRNIIAKKNCLIHKIYTSDGQVLKDKYSYVKKGDTIISGYIYSNDKIKATVSATGTIYGEVWYETKVTYPFNYYEEIKTGNKKTVLSINFFDNHFDVFNLKPFNDKIVLEEYFVRNKILPIKIGFEKQEEIIIKTGMNVVEEAKIKAIDLAYEKMNASLSEDEYVINYKVLESRIIDKGVEMKIFFSVLENVGEYQAIPEIKDVEE